MSSPTFSDALSYVVDPGRDFIARGVVAGVGLGPRPGVLGKAQLTVQREGVVGFRAGSAGPG